MSGRHRTKKMMRMRFAPLLISAAFCVIGFQNCDAFQSSSVGTNNHSTANRTTPPPPNPAPAPNPFSSPNTPLPSGALTRYSGNPLVRNGPESYDFEQTGPRVVLKMGATDYRMWYEAVGSNSITQVGYATSTDGLTWTKH